MAITVKELEDQFDVLYNSITSNQAPGLDIYEKSVFLTKAQTDVILSYFNERKNRVFQGYDGSLERQSDFTKLTKIFSKEYTEDSPITDANFDTRTNSGSVEMPTDILLILNEYVKVTRSSDAGTAKEHRLTVIPMEYTEYNRLMSKPYKRPLHYQAWRLITYDNSVYYDLVVGPQDKITEYGVRYIKKPIPIILGDLDDLTIEGYKYESDVTTDLVTNGVIEIDDILIEAVLQRAVELAKASYTGGLAEMVQLSGVSQTDISDSAKTAMSQGQGGR